MTRMASGRKGYDIGCPSPPHRIHSPRCKHRAILSYQGDSHSNNAHEQLLYFIELNRQIHHFNAIAFITITHLQLRYARDLISELLHGLGFIVQHDCV